MVFLTSIKLSCLSPEDRNIAFKINRTSSQVFTGRNHGKLGRNYSRENGATTGRKKTTNNKRTSRGRKSKCRGCFNSKSNEGKVKVEESVRYDRKEIARGSDSN